MIDVQTQNSDSDRLIKLLKVSFFGIITTFVFIFFVFKVIAVLTSAKPGPFFPFDFFANCHVADDTCPNKNITFWLYTR